MKYLFFSVISLAAAFSSAASSNTPCSPDQAFAVAKEVVISRGKEMRASKVAIGGGTISEGHMTAPIAIFQTKGPDGNRVDRMGTITISLKTCSMTELGYGTFTVIDLY